MTTAPFVSQANPAITAQIGGKTYSTSDASSGGVTVYDIHGEYQPGQQVPVVLNIPFRTFSLDVNLAAEVQNVDREQHALGLSFLNLSADHTAHLNRAMKAYASNDLIATNSLSKTVMRDNFIKVAKLAEPVAPMAPQAKKQIFGMSVATLLGLAALAFIGINVYKGVYTVTSNDAMVSVPSIPLRATASGVYTGDPEIDSLKVAKGQEVGMIAGASGPLVSPCDCLVIEKNAMDGAFVMAGDTVATLVPNDGKAIILAEVDAQRALRIANNTPVSVRVAGSEIDYTGKTFAVTSAMEAPPVAGVNTRYAKVKIKLDQDMPVEFAGKPAQVKFTVK